MTDLIYLPVNSGNWPDLEQLFEDRGGPSYCWCMVWRPLEKGKDRSNKHHKKEALKACVDRPQPIGLLGYLDGQPIAWCSIAPRETYLPLGGDDSLENAWSLVCFYIKRQYRKQRLTEQLISAAAKYAKENGARYLEAFPVDPDSPSYRFMGFRPTFERMGFQFVHPAGKRRYAMTLKL